MRILDVIIENRTPLSDLDLSTGATQPINQRNFRPNQVTWIKQQLERHRLVTGLRNGQFITGPMAWNGPIDDQWTTQLNQAIVAWKTSINIQLSGTPDGPLEVNPTSPGITRADRQYLETTELGNNGLIVVSPSGTPARARINSRGLLDGETYQPGVIPYGVEHVTDALTLVEAVGFSAWYRIAYEIQAVNDTNWLEKTDEQRGELTVATMRNAFYRDLTADSSSWLTNVGRARTRGKSATYADGSTQPFIMPELSPDFTEIYEYYTNMARRLWQKDQQHSEAARQTAADAAASPVTATTLDEPTLRAMATQLQAAFRNRPTAIFPGGRSYFNDEEAIQAILGRLRTAADFDNLSRVYGEVHGGEVLHERLFEELDKDSYMNIVVPKLLAIRRIAPTLIHSSIDFGDEDSVSVEYEGRTYQIQRELGPNGQPVIQGYDRDRNYDAIVIDNILKLGVETTGGRLPDFDTPADDESIAEAQIAFINTIQITYPEMVPFYVRAEPFDGASVDIGGARLRGIIDNVARMTGNQEAMTNYITQEIANDRDWLVGTEDTEPAADIRFDERYQSEGLGNREFPAVSADEDVELNANEEEILENLRSPQESVVNQAVDTLLQSDDPAQMWENIYRAAASSNFWLDESANMGDGERDVEEFLTGNTNSNSPIIRIATQLGSIIPAAPRVSAKMFDEAIRGLGTDEDTINALIGQIRNRYDYELVDERYRQLPTTDDSLIDALASEQVQGLWGGGWYARLAEIIGDEGRLELIRAELGSRVINAIQDVERSVTNDTIQDLRRAIGREDLTDDQMSVVIERLRSLVENMEESPGRLLLISYINELTGEETTTQSTPEIPVSP